MKKYLLVIAALFLLAMPAFAQTRIVVTCPANYTKTTNADGTTNCTAPNSGQVSCSTAGADPNTCTPDGSAAATPSTVPNTAPASANDRVSQGFSALGTTNTIAPATSNNNSVVTPCGANCNLGYTPLEPIPGITPTNGTYDLTTSKGFSNLINAIFKIMISVGALVAVVSLTVGGVQYMVSGSAALKGKAIERVKASLWGILLIAGIWLILNTLNPQLLNFNFNPCPVNSPSCQSINYSAPPTNSTNATTQTNSDVGYTGNVNDLVNNINNDTPNPAECAAAQVGTGVKSADDPGIIANLGSSLQRGGNQAYYIAKAAFWDNGINNTPSQIWSLGSAAINQIQTAESGFIAKCQAAGY